MSPTLCRARNETVRRRGFGLVEVVVSTLIVGVMMVAAMNTLGAFIRGQQHMAMKSRGWLLAQEIASEILACLYEEPDDALLFGRETGESSTSRALYDDIDDYDDWYSSPPKEKSGAVMSELAGWSRSVSVDWVSPSNPALAMASEQGVKRVTIQVNFRDEVVAELTAIRSRAWQEPPFN